MTEVKEAVTVAEGNGSLAPSLDDQIVQQIEFYFGDANLPHDKFIKLESVNNDGWFPANLLLKFNKLMGMMSSLPEAERLQKILNALQGSVLVEVHESNTKIRRNPEIPLPEGNAETKTVYLKGFNKTETKLETLIQHFSKYPGMERVIMRYYKEKCLVLPTPAAATPAAATPALEEAKPNDAEETANDATAKPAEVAKPTPVPSKAGDKIVWVKKFKGSIFVVFKTEEQAKSALEDITTYAGNPLMKMMQPDYITKKKNEFLERQQMKNSKKRKADGTDESSPKKSKGDDEAKEDEKEEEEEVLKGILLKLSEIPDTVTREVIKECWYTATGDKEKFEVTFIDFQRGDKDGTLRLANEGAATEALSLESLSQGSLALKDGATLKIAAFPDEEAEKTYILKMDKDRQNFKNRGGRGGGRGRGRGRGRGGRGRGRGRR